MILMVYFSDRRQQLVFRFQLQIDREFYEEHIGYDFEEPFIERRG